MIIPIKGDIPKSMKAYLQILNPVLKLKDKEIEVLSNFLSIWQSNKSKENLNKLQANKVIKKAKLFIASNNKYKGHN